MKKRRRYIGNNGADWGAEYAAGGLIGWRYHIGSRNSRCLSTFDSGIRTRTPEKPFRKEPPFRSGSTSDSTAGEPATGQLAQSRNGGGNERFLDNRAVHRSRSALRRRQSNIYAIPVQQMKKSFVPVLQATGVFSARFQPVSMLKILTLCRASCHRSCQGAKKFSPKILSTLDIQHGAGYHAPGFHDPDSLPVGVEK